MFFSKPVKVEARPGYKIWVKYADGPEGEVDLSDIADKEPYTAWRDRSFFETVHIAPRTEMISWGNYIEVCPDAVYLALTGLPVDALYPDIKEEVWVEDWKVMVGYRELLPELVEVEPRHGFRIWVRFDDEVSGEVDLSHLAGLGVFKAWDDRSFFESVYLSEYGVPAWGEGDGIIDIDALKLYMDITGKTVDEMLPELMNAPADV